MLLTKTKYMTTYIIIPGLGNSGEDHWQTFFEKSGDNFHRINQKEWYTPQCDIWVEQVEQELSNYSLPEVVLIAHSLGCLTVAHWAERYKHQVKGALLVAPADIDSLVNDPSLPMKGFSPIPLQPLNFPTILVGSENDPWCTIERAQHFAAHWGSQFISAGKAGHINGLSGYGEWLSGLDLIRTFN